MAMNNSPWVIFPLGDWPALHLPFRPVATDNHTAICASTALRKQDGCGVGGFPHESATLDWMIWIVQCLDCKPCRNTIFSVWFASVRIPSLDNLLIHKYCANSMCIYIYVYTFMYIIHISPGSQETWTLVWHGIQKKASQNNYFEDIRYYIVYFSVY